MKSPVELPTGRVRHFYLIAATALTPDSYNDRSITTTKMKIKSSLHPLTFGFDIGIASVGWAVLAPDRIVALGVRAFDKAETAKEGDSLNLVRRSARLMRRRLRRRAWRLKKLARLLNRLQLIDDAMLFQRSASFTQSLWQLRADALDRVLSAEEWARVIYHLCKHRGFHWTRAEEKAAAEDSKGESGKVKQGLAATAKLMQQKGYRSTAEMVLREFPGAQRNKQGDYGKSLARTLLGDELKLLFDRQRELGNTNAGMELEATVLGSGDRKSGIFWEQKPPLEGIALLKMLGRCTFEKAEYRAPKASFTAERHVWLTRLNNLRITVDGSPRSLTDHERQVALPLPYQYAGDFTFKQLRAALTKAGCTPDSFRFAGLPYPSAAQQAAGKSKDPEASVLVKLPAWQELRQTLRKAGLETEWEGMAGSASDGRPEPLDDIAWVLSVYKDEDEVASELRKLALPNADRMIEALLGIRFDKFHALSIKALRRIVPFMGQGLRYDEACAHAGYNHSQAEVVPGEKGRLLPPLYSGRDARGSMIFSETLDVPRNPVVLRALNQARKVMNALVREYGAPHAVHIEMARNLTKPLDERRKIERDQAEYRQRNDLDKGMFAESFGRLPTGLEFEKWRLYREQQSKCAYSVEALDINRLLDQGYVEIDHALPYSRSFDDSKNNKVLVLAKENRDKGNRTPYEYLRGGDDSERWRRFVAFVESNKAYRLAKRSRLLRKDFAAQAAEEFKERNLNDTRYVCRFFKNYVERHLQLAEGTDVKRCVVLSGQLTSFLRARWGLVKLRTEGDRHHALDAAVVAACGHAMVKRLSDYSRRKELGQVREGFVDPETGEIPQLAMHQQLREHFPDPWPHFRRELEARLKIDDAELLRSEMKRFGTYPDDDLDAVKPLFVSRAPQRRNGGAAHKETIYSKPKRFAGNGSATQKVPLSTLSLKDLDNLADPDRNAKLYAAIRERLEQNGGKGEKAFPPDNPLRKPSRDGNGMGPVVRTVTMVIDKLSGIPVRGGIARNGEMLRVDVFAKSGRYFLVPLYVHHGVEKELPNLAIVANKDEAEWTLIDDSYDWRFSLWPNDLLQIKLKDTQFLGYFAGCDRSTGAIKLWAQDRDRRIGDDGLIRGIGVKTAVDLQKFHVDVLGKRFVAQKELRRGLA